MMAKELYAKPDHPCQCEAYRVTRYALRYEMAHPDKRCLRIATIEIARDLPRPTHPLRPTRKCRMPVATRHKRPAVCRPMLDPCALGKGHRVSAWGHKLHRGRIGMHEHNLSVSR